MIMSHTNPSVMKKKKIHMLANAFATPTTLLHAIYGETKIKNRSITNFKLKRLPSAAILPNYFCICFDHHNQIKIRLNNYF